MERIVMIMVKNDFIIIIHRHHYTRFDEYSICSTSVHTLSNSPPVLHTEGTDKEVMYT